MKPTPMRPGYALMLVLVFLALFLSLLGLAFRQLGSALRAEAIRSRQIQRDQGCIQALARGLALLETGFPPSDPYVCSVTLNTSTGLHSFTVTFASEGGNNWSAHSAPTGPNENPQPMPNTFAP